MRITQADLTWWLETASQLTWTWATTYAESAPHRYVVDGRTEGLTKNDYVRAGRVIHTFGQPCKFYTMTNIYLASPDGDLKWWTMDLDVTDTNLVNQAATERLYGVQNAPVTASAHATSYDSLATSYDVDHPLSAGFAAEVRQAAKALKGDYSPSVLDIGCGTGRVLDLELTTSDRYAGVDPSGPMLNQLVRKHPDVAAVHPATAAEVLQNNLFTPGQFEIVTILLGKADSLDSATLHGIKPIASRGLIIARDEQLEVIHV